MRQPYYYIGIKADIKPVNVPIDSYFYESDSGDYYMTRDGITWEKTPKPPPWLNNSDNRNRKALEIAAQYGTIDGWHHKAWVIDQMVRALIGTPEAYAAWRKENKDWDEGIAP